MIDPHDRGPNGWNPEFERRQAQRRAREREIKAVREHGERVAGLMYQLGSIEGRLAQQADLLFGGTLPRPVAEALTLAAKPLLDDRARLRADLEALGVNLPTD